MTGYQSKKKAAQDKEIVTDIDGHVVRDVRKPKKALPHAALLAELMNPNNPKNEREHAAVRKIERLQKALAQPAQEPVGEVNRYGLDSHGRKWHAIYLWAQWPNKEKNS